MMPLLRLMFPFLLLQFAQLGNAANESIVAHLVRLTEAAQAYGAVALDGSPASYHIAFASGPTNASKWHVHLQGGGWCLDAHSCAARAKGGKGSSNFAPNNLSTRLLPDGCSTKSGYLSGDPLRNPTMYDWNHVHVNYVDGGSFAGNRSDPLEVNGQKLYFRGKRVLHAVISDLLAKGMVRAQDVVVTGCSAGGLAVYLHADYIASLLSPATRLAVVPDSGYFLAEGSFEKSMRGIATLFNMATNSACQAAQASKPGDCVFAQNVVPYIKTPIFAIQSIFDGWQLDAICRPPDWAKNTSSPIGEHYCWGGSRTCLASVNAYGSRLNASLTKGLLSDSKHAGFIDSCNHHCGSWTSDLTSADIDVRIDGQAAGDAFDIWYRSNKTHPSQLWQQDKPFPCEGCCHPPRPQAPSLFL